MAHRQGYALTETEILALQLHRNLHGHGTFADDVEALVEELEGRSRRSDGVNEILEQGRHFLAGHRQSG
ncbi:hypothetical protein ACFW16_28445 [Inquilinus sp. NPDC058860]|uniref:hypothetical protein n=1 Tax=Inquilinus sp. NPDC058860 TaxID=3346652 RepID=UPI00369CBEB6